MGKQITNGQGKYIIDKIKQNKNISDICVDFAKKINIDQKSAKKVNLL